MGLRTASFVRPLSYMRDLVHCFDSIECPTCHLGYFTPGRLVLSPPLPVLEWIMEKLQGAEDSQAVWEVGLALYMKNTNDMGFRFSPSLMTTVLHTSSPTKNTTRW